LVASWAEETTFSPLACNCSKHLEYLDNRLMVASGTLENFTS